MIEAICRELNNYFDTDSEGNKCRYFGTFAITDGTIGLSGTGIKDGQYFRIVGSALNDGVYQYPADGLTDETFDGAVWLMFIPKAVFALADEISAWNEKYGGLDSQASSPFNSESFGGYSYSKGSGSGTTGTDAGTWQSQFSSRLNKWRKISAV